jgi:epoxyqueuosine reductase
VEQNLTQRIREQALALGFSSVGVARAAVLQEEGLHLTEWLNKGFHASMSWMGKNPEKRIDMDNVLPGVKSVVCVTLNYYSEVIHSDAPGTGKISRYAWGDDYHIIMTDRLKQLLRSIQFLQPEVHGKVYVDTGPVMDKVWASRAGLGWQGKHTNLITKEFGSWVFLAAILLDVGLEYDEPIADACGTCTACIEACPTQAIIEPYILDSNRCISYLTIEHRGDIPSELSKDFNGWIYGCDICQDVCPWNRFQQPTIEPAFQPRTWNIAPELKQIAQLTKDEFNDHYRKSPIKRTKRVGLIRNAMAVAKDSMNLT